jgi:predicted metal-dependent phosphoesterase TrpH
VIDLHLHTTASDGRLSPEELVARASRVGLRIISVTDHDTTAGLAEVRAATQAAGIELVDGIEVTAVHDHRDVHVLGYFIDTTDADLAVFLEAQRQRRIERLHAIARHLSALGLSVDIDEIVAGARRGASVGRPLIARALMKGGHVGSIQEAFERYLGTGRPAFVPRVGCSPAEVVAVIHDAGGIAALAHPGVTKQPSIIGQLAADGLDALEVYHSDHSPTTTRDMLALARELRIGVSGGSDFHGDEDRHRPLGGVSLPADHYHDLVARRARRG